VLQDVTSQNPLAKRAVAEAFGTALLLAAIVGSGIMAERLSGRTGEFAFLIAPCLDSRLGHTRRELPDRRRVQLEKRSGREVLWT